MEKDWNIQPPSYVRSRHRELIEDLLKFPKWKSPDNSQYIMCSLEKQCKHKLHHNKFLIALREDHMLEVRRAVESVQTLGEPLVPFWEDSDYALKVLGIERFLGPYDTPEVLSRANSFFGLFGECKIEPWEFSSGGWNISEDEFKEKYSTQKGRERIIIKIQSILGKIMDEIFSVASRGGDEWEIWTHVSTSHPDVAKHRTTLGHSQYERAWVKARVRFPEMTYQAAIETSACLWEDVTAVVGSSLIDKHQVQLILTDLFLITEVYRVERSINRQFGRVDDETFRRLDYSLIEDGSLNKLNGAPLYKERENELQEHIWGFYDTFGEMLIKQGVVSRCKNKGCGKLFRYRPRYPRKMYCSTLFEGRNCRKVAANRRYYEKHEEDLKEKARKEMKETRAFYKEKGVK